MDCGKEHDSLITRPWQNQQWNMLVNSLVIFDWRPECFVSIVVLYRRELGSCRRRGWILRVGVCCRRGSIDFCRHLFFGGWIFSSCFLPDLKGQPLSTPSRRKGVDAILLKLPSVQLGAGRAADGVAKRLRLDGWMSFAERKEVVVIIANRKGEKKKFTKRDMATSQ